MRTERLEFTGASGARLSALIDFPLGAPDAFALFAHCFTCGRDNRAARRIAERLANNGIAALTVEPADLDRDRRRRTRTSASG